jgi:hypothetical protein
MSRMSRNQQYYIVGLDVSTHLLAKGKREKREEKERERKREKERERE